MARGIGHIFCNPEVIPQSLAISGRSVSFVLSFSGPIVIGRSSRDDACVPGSPLSIGLTYVLINFFAGVLHYFINPRMLGQMPAYAVRDAAIS